MHCFWNTRHEDGFEDVLKAIHGILIKHIDNVHKLLKLKKIKEVKEFQPISFSLDLLNVVCNIFLPHGKFEVGKNGDFFSDNLISTKGNKIHGVVSFKRKFDEMVVYKGTSIPVFSVEDKNPEGEILDKHIAQSMALLSEISKSLFNMHFRPQVLYTFIHNGIAWVVVLFCRTLNDLQYFKSERINYIIKKDKTIANENVLVMAKIYYVVMQNTKSILNELEKKIKILFRIGSNHIVIGREDDGDDADYGGENDDKFDDTNINRTMNSFQSLKMPSSGLENTGLSK
eukprot:gene9398-12658_t